MKQHPTPIADEVNKRLQKLANAYQELINESNNHAGYYDGKETHFKLTIVNDEFAGKRLVQRHQFIYHLLQDLLVQGGGQIHALAIHAYTPDEWQGQSPNSPKCAGHHKG